MTWIMAAWTFLKSSKWARWGIAGGIILIIILANLNTVINTTKKWKAVIEAIKNPAKTETVYIDRVIERTITKTVKGDTITVEKIKEVAGKTTESKPVIPEVPASVTRGNKSFYISGGAGYGLGDNQPTYLLGGGVYLLDWVSVGAQVQAKQDGGARAFVIASIYF